MGRCSFGCPSCRGSVARMSCRCTGPSGSSAAAGSALSEPSADAPATATDSSSRGAGSGGTGVGGAAATGSGPTRSAAVQDLLEQAAGGFLLLSLWRNLGLLGPVFRFTGRTPGLFDFLLDHCHDDVIGYASFTGAIVIEYVTKPRLALLHQPSRRVRSGDTRDWAQVGKSSRATQLEQQTSADQRAPADAHRQRTARGPAKLPPRRPDGWIAASGARATEAVAVTRPMTSA